METLYPSRIHLPKQKDNPSSPYSTPHCGSTFLVHVSVLPCACVCPRTTPDGGRWRLAAVLLCVCVSVGFPCSQEEWPLAGGLGVEHHALWDLGHDSCSHPTSQMARDDLRATAWSFRSGHSAGLLPALSLQVEPVVQDSSFPSHQVRLECDPPLKSIRYPPRATLAYIHSFCKVQRRSRCLGEIVRDLT